MSLPKKIALSLMVIASIFSIWWGYENIRGKRAWEDFKKEWEAKGEVFDFKTVIPKAIPSEKNFAHTPLLKPLGEIKYNADLTQAKPIDPKKHEEAKNLMKIGDKPSVSEIGNGWQTGEALNLAGWQKYYRETEGWEHPEQAGKPSDDVLLALSKFESVMAELAQAAKDRPLCRFDNKYEAHWNMRLDHLKVYRQITFAYALRASAHLANEDPEAALADIQMGLFIAESIRDEPTIISQLVRFACLNIIFQPLWEGLKGSHWAAKQLTELEQKLAGIDLLEGYRISMRGERVLTNESIRVLREESSRWAEENEEVDLEAFTWLPAGFLYSSQKRISEIHFDYLMPMVDYKARRIRTDLEVQLEKRMTELKKVRYGVQYNILASIFIPGLSKVALKTGRSQTGVDHALIACRLELHKLKTGEYPEQLADLGTAAPSDLFSGKPYVYKPDSNGRYQLYGLGWNEKDDGGKVNWTGSKNVDDGDIVWSYSPLIPPEGE